MDLPDSDRGDFSCRRAVDSSSFFLYGNMLCRQCKSKIYYIFPSDLLNILRQNGLHFPDDIFKWIFLNENVWITINISLKFIPRGPINNIPTLVQVMAWRRPGNKRLSEPMMVRLPTHICVTQPQWVNTLRATQNGCFYADDISKCIYFNENIWILNKIPPKYVP